jgi:type II secretory pathway component GspD/PulD (secretin)
MKRLRRVTRTWTGLVFVLVVPAVLAHAEAANDQTGRIGRENPFGEIMTIPVQAAVPQTQRVVEEIPELSLETVVLKFLDATSLKTVLDSMVRPFGTVAVNKENNSVIICDTPENLARILAQIKQADQTPQQVMIEVVILDVQLNDSTEIGINWDLLTADRPNAVYRQNFSGSRLGSTIESADTLGNATAFNTTGLGGDFSVISGTVRQVLHMIQQKKNAEILASPSILVVSGRSATIKVVEEVPYRALIDTGTGGQDALSTTQFKEVGINLQVSAVVADSNNIFLTVDAEQNVRTGQSTDGVPVVDTRRATTSLMLEDSQIVIIGGLRRQEKTKEVKQVPILGDLPIVGNLFKSTSKVTYNSELVVLLSPHIDKGGPLPSPIAGKYHAAHDQTLLSGGGADSVRSAGAPVGTGGQRAVED